MTKSMSSKGGGREERERKGREVGREGEVSLIARKCP